ncbi:MAG TPA: Calx-beta domain-containing protein [Prolixibacteraceae bacterium]|jgi:hypothetical protein
MIRNLLPSKKIVFFFVLLLTILAGMGNQAIGQVTGDYRSAGTGNWGSIGTWERYSGTAWVTATAIPTAATNVTIQSGHTISENSNPAVCKDLTITGSLLWPRNNTLNASGNLVINGTPTSGGTIGPSGNKTGILNVTGTFTVPTGTTANIQRLTTTITGATSISGTLNFTVNINGTKTFGGLVTINSGGTWNNAINESFTFRGGILNNGTLTAGTGIYLFSNNSQSIGGSGTISIPTVTVTGITLTNNNTLSVTTALGGTGSLVQAANATLNIGGTSAITTLTATATGNTVNYNKLGTQTVKTGTYYNLSLSGSLAKTLPNTLTSITNNLALSGIATSTTTVGLTIGGGLSIGNGATFTAAGFALTVGGTTTVGGGTSGILNITSATGVKTFTGLVSINTGATWNNSGSSPIVFKGGITNLATFTAGSGIQTFNTNSQSLTGIFVIPNVTVTGVTLTNTNTLTVSTALSGSGTLAQAANATLNIGGTSAITTLTASATGNTVNFTGLAQTVNGNSYYHLNLSGTGAKTMPVIPIAVAGNFSTAGAVSANAGANISFNGNVTLVSGTSFNAGIYSHSVGGNWINNGATFTPSTGTVTFNGSAVQSIGGTASSTFYNLAANNASGITLSKPANTNSLILMNGKITTNTTNLLTVTGSSPTDISGNFTSSYINGPLALTLPPSLVNGTYLFPVGKSTYNPLSLIEANTTSAGTLVIMAEVFDGASGGTPGVGMSSLNTIHYWNAAVSSGTSFTNTKIQLTETGLAVEDAIGQSATQTGAYNRISNLPPTGDILTSDLVTTLGYFGIGEKPILTIVATSDGTEGGSNGLFTITTSKQFTISRTIDLLISGTATNGTDFTTITTPVTFPASQSTITLPVTIINDVSVEPAETVIVSIVAGTGYAIGTPSTATVNIIDNDIAGITVTPSSGLVTTEAGGTATFTIVLNTLPTANVSIVVSSNDLTEGMVSTSTVIFTTANWNVPQTVTVTGLNDDVQDGNIIYSIITDPASSADLNYKNLNALDVSVTNTDNDVAGITVTPISGLVTTEGGGTATFTLVLNSQPTADVTVALSSDDTSEGNGFPASVTFTSLNWNVAQTVTVTGVNDYMIDGNIPYHIVTSLASSTDPLYSVINPSDVSVTNNDDDVAGVTVTPISGLVTSESGGTNGSATFTVVLNSQPSADVIISIASDNTNEGTVSPSTVTFTNGNWNSAQTITILGVDDLIDDGNIVYHINTGACVSGDLNYSGFFPRIVSVTNNDNDAIGISVSSNSLITTEAPGIGHTKTFTIVLNTQPTANVTIGLTSSNINEGTVSPASLTFNTSNYSIPQVVTVTGYNDDVDDGDQTFTILTAAATGGGYDGLNATDVTVTNLDDDVAGITVSPTSGLTTTEALGTASFTIKLNSQPTGNVTIGVSSNDITEGDVTPTSVTFTSGNWNTAQSITVTGKNDDVQDGNILYSIVTAQATSTDPLYSIINPSDVSVTNTDNDIAGFTVSPTSGLITNEAGLQTSFTIRLSSQPTANVVVNLTSSDTGEGTVSPALVTFTAGNWAANQTVTITGVDDYEMDGNSLYSIITAVSPGGDAIYNAINPSDVTVTNNDNDVAGFTINPSSGLTTTEGGGTATFTLKLNSQPTANVTIGLSSSNTNEGTVSPASLTFTVGNWNTTQTVTVTGVNDFVQDGSILYSIVTAAATSSDVNYNTLNALDVSVTNTDNDVAGITVNPTSGLTTTEAGGSVNFSIVLTSQPTTNVTISLSSSKTNEGTVSPTSVVFTPSDWNTARTVTVSGVDDNYVDGTVAYTIITAAAVSGDPNYSGVNAADVSVSNTDNDVAGITITPTTGLATNEDGSTATFTVVLNTIPTANVIIALSSNIPAEGTVSPASITLSPATWNVPVTVTITGVDDLVDDDNINYTIVTGIASSTDTHYNGLIDPSDVSVTNVDNDVAGITISAISGLITTEAGGSMTFKVVLDTKPISNVTVNIVSSNGTEGTASPSNVTFTPTNWLTPVTVTITGKDDNANDGDITYAITSTVAAGSDAKYIGQTGDDILLTNIDNDTPGITVTPNSGLVTTEAGGTATFTMVLITKPKNDVTVTLSSSDPAEGSVLPTSLVFTNSNWDSPRTVTITGVNDILADGNKTYSILSDAVSSDLDYDGIEIADVNVTNMDLTPFISSFSPSAVCFATGASVIITGTFFTGATFVKFNGVNAASYTVNSSTQITATVPATATSGTISITTATGTAVSSSSLEVSPVSVGGSVTGGTTTCSGSSSGLLTLSGHVGTITKWQSSISPFTAWTDIVNTASTYTSGALTQDTQYRAVVTSGACSSANSSTTTVTVRPSPTASISGSTTVCQNTTSPNITFTNPLTLAVTITYNINGANQTTINVGASSSATIGAPTTAAGAYAYNLVSVVYQTAPTCSSSLSGAATVVVTAPPSATAGTAIIACNNSGAVNITAGSVAANYSSVLWTSNGTGAFANATSLTTATYTPSAADITAGSVQLTLTALANSPCGNATSTKAFTMTSLPAATISYSGTPYCNNLAGNQSVTRTGTAGGTYSATPVGLTIDAITGAITSSTSTSGTYTVTYTMAAGGGCSIQTATASLTITSLPDAAFSYTSSPYCNNGANPSPTLGVGAVAGVYSSTTGLVFVSTSTGQINLAASTPGTYTVTNTIAAAGGCGIVSSTATVSIVADGYWTGAVNADWNTAGNWACNQVPTLVTNVTIASGKPNYPTLFAGGVGKANNLIIESGASVTVTANPMQIAGTISNNGSFTASAGTIEMKGTIAQTIGANVFVGNTILNLTVNNSAGVTLQGPLNVTGIVLAMNGNLNSSGNLTLVSSATQTALIDGAGTGNVVGNIIMQRYLASAFGYKYFSSPFQAATVAEFSPEVDLSSTFPSFFKYDENNSDPAHITNYTSGWVKYNTPANLLFPMVGYAANFGPQVTASNITVDMTGGVNNGDLQIALFNRDREFTQGFNLVGNPYPSPINWNAAGWTKTNIDNALYFFNASGDQYSGTYSSYAGGVSTDVGDNVIAAMQGFFVHVSDGVYPVNGVLGINNSVRINNLNPVFKKAVVDNRTILRFTANLETQDAIDDAMVIYFDQTAKLSFDRDLDALKMANTDLLVPNLYTITPESKKLSINGMPLPTDSISKIPLGISTFTEGWVTIQAKDISQLPANLYIYLVDAETSTTLNLKQLPDYRFYLKTGQYNNRFTLVFSQSELNGPTIAAGKLFTLSRSGDLLLVKVNLGSNVKGNLLVTNLLGQKLMQRAVVGNETVEINPSVSTGVYVITLISGKLTHSEKIIMRKDYE